MKFSFLKRTVLAFFVCTLLLLWGAVSYLTVTARHDALTHARLENENLADALSAYTDLVFSSIKTRHKEMAEHYPAGAVFTPLDPEITQFLGSRARETKGIRSLNIFSSDGIMIQSGIARENGEFYAPKKLINFSERPYFRTFADNWTPERQNELFISSPVKSKVTGKWTLPISFPRASSNDEFPGLVVSAMVIGDFMNFYSASELSQDQVLSVMHDNGTMMLLTCPPKTESR